jgi:phosphate transport system substrate-binding protein
LISSKITRRAAVLAAVPAVAFPAAAAAKPIISMSGSTTVAPLAALLAREYNRECRHCVTFKLLQGGSNVGIADVGHGRVSIGNSSRDPNPNLATDQGLVFTPIARDAVCIITNNANQLGVISQATVQQVFSGRVVDWGSVPGSPITGTIDLYTRAATSGTHDAFQKLFMNPFSVSTTAHDQSSNGLVELRVSQDRLGIGYVSLHFGGGVHEALYQGVRCNLRNAKDGSYPGVRNLYMVTRGNPTGIVARWIHWIRTNSSANAIIATGWVPLH